MSMIFFALIRRQPFVHQSTLSHVSTPFLQSSLFTLLRMSQHRRSSDFTKFRELFEKSKRIVALTGAGVSAESGVPTFRGEGGLWRRYQATALATPQAFAADPTLVWQFYEYRRQLVATKYCL